MSQANILENTDRFLRRSDVENLIGFKSSRIYEMVNEGSFPRPLKIGGAARWSQRSVAAWIEAQKAVAA